MTQKKYSQETTRIANVGRRHRQNTFTQLRFRIRELYIQWKIDRPDSKTALRNLAKKNRDFGQFSRRDPPKKLNVFVGPCEKLVLNKDGMLRQDCGPRLPVVGFTCFAVHQMLNVF